MSIHPWVEEFPGAIMVCDPQGIVLEMNAQAVRYYAKDGGERLIGTNVLECHPEPARSRLREMLEKQQPNVYTIEKNGVRKLIYQVPWTQNGVYGGFLEMQLETPQDLPHFVRG